MFGNTLWLFALGYYCYITFLGYSCEYLFFTRVNPKFSGLAAETPASEPFTPMRYALAAALPNAEKVCHRTNRPRQENKRQPAFSNARCSFFTHWPKSNVKKPLWNHVCVIIVITIVVGDRPPSHDVIT